MPHLESRASCQPQIGIITGNPDGTLNPTGTVTRAQVATMLMRVVKTMVK